MATTTLPPYRRRDLPDVDVVYPLERGVEQLSLYIYISRRRCSWLAATECDFDVEFRGDGSAFGCWGFLSFGGGRLASLARFFLRTVRVYIKEDYAGKTDRKFCFELLSFLLLTLFIALILGFFLGIYSRSLIPAWQTFIFLPTPKKVAEVSP